MKNKEERFAFERFQRFFYPVLDLDEGKPDDPKERARLCWEHFVKPWALEMVNNVEVTNSKLTPGLAWSDGVQDTFTALRKLIEEATK